MINEAKVISTYNGCIVRYSRQERQLQLNVLQIFKADLDVIKIKSNTNFLHVNTHGQNKMVLISALVMVQSSSNYSTLYFIDGSKIFTSKTLKYWAHKIGHNFDFVRIHSRNLINRNHLISFDKKLNVVSLKTGISAKCSRNRKVNLFI